MEKEYKPRDDISYTKITFHVDYPPGYPNAYKTLERFRALLQKNYPLIHQTEFRFFTNETWRAIFEIDYISENPLTSDEERFFIDSKKFFSPYANIKVSVEQPDMA